jgi:hypothetical protein
VPRGPERACERAVYSGARPSCLPIPKMAESHEASQNQCVGDCARCLPFEIRSSWPGLPPSLTLRRPSEFVARRSLGGDGSRPSTSLAPRESKTWMPATSVGMTKMTKSASAGPLREPLNSPA